MITNNLNAADLKTAFLSHLDNVGLHPLHEAILEETCENLASGTLSVKTDDDTELDNNTLIGLSMLHSVAALKGTLQGVFASQNANMITLTYRNQQFAAIRGHKRYVQKLDEQKLLKINEKSVLKDIDFQ
jgi:hypothetical protein